MIVYLLLKTWLMRFKAIFFILLLFSLKAFSQIPMENLKVWLIGDSVEINNGFVEKWYDISGNDFHMIQSNNSRKPTQLFDETLNHNTLKFNGDFLKVEFDTIFEQPLSIFIMWKLNELKAQTVFDGISASHRIIFDYP